MCGAAPVFTVTHCATSSVHYRDLLGFTITYDDGEYVTLSRDDTKLHLCLASVLRIPAELRRLPGQGGAYVFSDDVDALHEEFQARGVRIQRPPQTHDYGMRDFNVLDLEGNQLVFGMSV
jgi:catechol 2,3-dioxygenase-like lactoylglutathione lyase family enzyme